MQKLYSNKILLNTSPHAFGELLESVPDFSNLPFLREQLEKNGYLLFRGFINPESIHKCKRSIVGDLKKNNHFLGQSKDYKNKKYKETLNCGGIASIRDLIKNGPIIDIFSMIFGEPATSFDYIWSRIKGPEVSEIPHCDSVFMQGTKNLYTAWIPLMDVPLNMGPIMILDKSHGLDRLNSYRSLDVDADRLKRMLVFKHGKFFKGVQYSKNPDKIQKEFGLRWLTTDFQIGDVLIFSAHALHCTLDNNSDKLRISVDARYQPKSEPIDNRYMGENPIGHRKIKPIPSSLKNIFNYFRLV